MTSAKDGEAASAIPETATPVVDLARFRSGGAHDRAAVAGAFDEACRTTGMFYLAGHGIDPAVTSGAQQAAYAFFAEPTDYKLRFRQPRSFFTIRGYEPFESEHLAALDGKTSKPDRKESLSIGPPQCDDPDSPYPVTSDSAYHTTPNDWPDRPPALRPALDAYIRAMSETAQTLYRVAACALDLPEDHFVAATLDARSGQGWSLLRAIHYPAVPEAADFEQPRAGEHSDYDNFTICRIEEGHRRALQYRAVDGAWIDVPAKADSFVVNIGDFFQRQTNDRWRAVKHRVVTAPGRARLTLCYFSEPRFDAEIAVLPTQHSAADPPKYQPTTSSAYMTGQFATQSGIED